MSHIFALLTDFGCQDPYVGQMKAVILQKVPDAVFVDISHAISPHNIMQAAFFLGATWAYLPEKTMCLVVVDPGVGTSRSIVLISRENKYLLVPDNGVSSMIFEIPGQIQCWRIHPNLFAETSSLTFHGRDIFAPLAVSLACGVDPETLATTTRPESIHQISLKTPCLTDDRLETVVMHIDHFGNCVLNMAMEDWKPFWACKGPFQMLFPHNVHVFPVSTYAHIPEGGFGLLPGSQGFLELSCQQQACAQRLGLKIGDVCVFQVPESLVC